jgi:D-alanyl-D-alanine carboxypeptidase/D-alanyl-D-alanine-endopeptidase (penicillin-binding protein 4)
MPAILPGLSRLLFLLCCLTGSFCPSPASGGENVQRLINNGGYMVDDGSGQHQFREKEPFIPASTLKILTSLAALEILGPTYRFETHFFLDGRQNLYIKGYGDPMLASASLLDIGRKLSGLGIRRLRSIRLDDSAFALQGETASTENSTNSYDAPNGALAVNFNSLPVLVAENGTVSSGESETPLLPLMREVGSRLPPGFHRLNIDMLPGITGKSSALRYVAELFTAQLQQAGITIATPWKRETVPPNLQPILIHQSGSSLQDIIRECLKYSNNFIANQLYLACGMKTYGPPATWKKSRQTFFTYYTTTLGLSPDLLVMVEGSGLSRQNRISPAALIEILNRFKPFAALLSRRETIPVKSGTLTGVYCYVGYFEKDEALIPFAILLNQPENTRDQLLKELKNGAARPAATP